MKKQSEESLDNVIRELPHSRTQETAVPSKAIRAQILTEFVDDPIEAVPLWKEPLCNAQMVLCNFMTFDQAIGLCDAIVANELKAKKRCYTELAQLLYPLYTKFTGYVSDRRVFFYDTETRLWMLNNSMEPSVMFLLGLVRQFLDGPFRRIQQDCLNNCHPDDTEIREDIRKTIGAITKLYNLDTSGSRRELTKQLRKEACMRDNDETSKLALKFGQDVDWLPFRNGVDVNVYTMETRVRMRHHRQVHCCNIDWNPNPDRDLLECIRQFFLTVASQQSELMMDLLVQAFIIFSGKNHKFIFVNLGFKSTLLRIYEAILGDFAIRPAKSTFCESRITASSRISTLSQLAFKRLILLDDQFGVHDRLALPLLKRITTPNNEELVRDAFCKDMFKISVNGIVVFCLNPKDIPKSLCVCGDPALTRRFIIMHHETRFVSKAMFDGLPTEHQTSGYYAIADEVLLEKMMSQPLLEALAYFILREGGREYHRRCAAFGEPFTPNIDLFRRYFGRDFDDFEEWWKAVTVETEPEAKESLSMEAVTERYNRDHPDYPYLQQKVVVTLLRKIFPLAMVHRTVAGDGRAMCVMNVAFVQEQLPSASPVSDVSADLTPVVASCSSDPPPPVIDDVIDEFEEFAGVTL